ncbi:MAG: peptidoglycan DD-metalloendopeptidase family protein [Cocleimonas sp.]
MKNTLIIFTLFISQITTLPLLAFPRNDLKPGGIAVLSVLPSNKAKPKVTYQKKPVAVIKGNQNWLAVVGIPLSAKIGRHNVTVMPSASNNKINKSFSIKNYSYRTQHLTIKNKNKVNPNKKSTKRIEREFFLKKKLKKTHTATPPHFNFIRPTTGRDSGRFGARRILNKQKRNPHSGMDIAAPTGRSVKSAEAGRVIFAGDLFFTGNVVYVDHGNGLLSLYAHLSQINVKKGQQVKRGQIIGKVGKTGRVTGPHLHWSVYLNGNAVDPSLFLPTKKHSKKANKKK